MTTTFGLLVPGAGRVTTAIDDDCLDCDCGVDPKHECFIPPWAHDIECPYRTQIPRRNTMAGVSTDYSKHSNQRITAADLDSWFTYHAPKGDQQERYANLREIAKELAILMVKYCPPCADTTAAIRQLRESVMSANAAIACNE